MWLHSAVACACNCEVSDHSLPLILKKRIWLVIPPLSYCSFLIFLRVCVSIIFSHWRKIGKTEDLIPVPNCLVNYLIFGLELPWFARTPTLNSKYTCRVVILLKQLAVHHWDFLCITLLQLWAGNANLHETNSLTQIKCETRTNKSI